MMQIFKKAGLYLILTLFVTASSGLFFIMHHCNSHHHSMLVFVKEVSGDCCDHDCNCSVEKRNISSSSCCSLNKSAESHGSESMSGFACCSDRPFFAKIVQEYEHNAGISLPHIPELELFRSQAFDFMPELSSVPFFEWPESPPGRNTSSGIPVFHSSLLI